MRKTCKITLNKETFHAKFGELLLDGAIMSGIDIPHDCRAGACGTCRVKLVDGKVFGGSESGSDMIYACQARIVSDLKLATEAVPETVSVSARVADLTRVASDVMSVRLELPQPLTRLPGQYCKVQFRGYPERCYSPTYPLEGGPDERSLHLHIRRFPDGAVSSALGGAIGIGHRVRLTGPFGHAFFRPKHAGRTVLVASGTGFAPMWSIAVAAITERPQRELVFVAAARKLQSFYMHAALCRLALFPNVTIIPVVSERQSVSPALRNGRPTDFLPALSSDDVVYTSGAPALTSQVAALAKAAGAACHTDPFIAQAGGAAGHARLISRFTGWFDGSRKTADALQAA